MRSIIILVAVVCIAAPARAVILSAKATRNTKTPTGSLTDSGWQWQGRWFNYLGTPISRKYFITAGHIGGNVGDSLILGGKKYKTIATYDDPESDLQIWQIRNRFPTWAPLFKEESEIGRTIMLFGRGSRRGVEVDVNGQVKGWRWGDQDMAQSWGKNVITGTGPAPTNPEASPLEISGDQISYTFDRNGVGHEATVSVGDSGGGVFVKTGPIWRLVGITTTVESGVSLPGSFDVFDAALLDFGGLRAGGDTLIPDSFSDRPSHGYATRVSARIDWIYDVMNGAIAPSAGAVPTAGVPEPAGIAITGVALVLLGSRRTRRPI